MLIYIVTSISVYIIIIVVVIVCRLRDSVKYIHIVLCYMYIYNTHMSYIYTQWYDGGNGNIIIFRLIPMYIIKRVKRMVLYTNK